LTEPFSEKYVKKLFGKRTGIEDALKRLDRLTEEEAQMAAAQVLKATHTVDDTGRVRGVADIAVSVEKGVAGVGDQVQGVSDQVQGVGDQVQGVGDQVQSVRDQVQGVNNMVSAGGRPSHGWCVIHLSIIVELFNP
jgi:methyl-accepting chemotaxis protein